MDAFDRHGHLHVRGFYRSSEIRALQAALERAKQHATRAAGDADHSLNRDVSLSIHSPEVRAFVLDPRLGALAARLLGARGVRLIHDVLFEKAFGQGTTPWHRDSDFWPFTGAGALTAWIPLQDTPLAMSPLRYASGSHRGACRWPPKGVAEMLIPFRYRVRSSPLAVGDVVLHHYRTLHGAGRNHERRPRRALAVHLIDADARFRSPGNAGQLEHAVRCRWTLLRDGDPFTEEIAPLVYAA